MLKTFAAALAASLIAGCASLTDGTEQTVVIDVTPREATCVASRGGTELSSFSGRNPTITMSKGARDVLIECRAPGYDTKVNRLVSSTKGAGMVSFMLLDLGITDMITGAMWKYPSNSSILLQRSIDPSTGAESVAPKVAVVAVAKPLTGEDLFNVNRLAIAESCDANPKASMTGKGPSYEVYTVPCAKGDTLTVRCEFGNCRSLK